MRKGQSDIQTQHLGSRSAVTRDNAKPKASVPGAGEQFRVLRLYAWLTVPCRTGHKTPRAPWLLRTAEAPNGPKPRGDPRL